MLYRLATWLRNRRAERSRRIDGEWWDRVCAVQSSAPLCKKCGSGIDWQPDNAPQTLICEKCYLKGIKTINLLDAPDADYHRLMDELEFEAFGRVITPKASTTQPGSIYRMEPEVDAEDDLRAAIADARAAQDECNGLKSFEDAFFRRHALNSIDPLREGPE